MILLSHPGATDNIRHVARALERAGLLGELWTCPAPHHVGQRAPTDPLEAALRPAPASTEQADTQQAALGHSLDCEVSERLTSELFTGIYAFEGAAAASFHTAGEHGLLRFYDLPAGHWRAEQLVCEEESALEPEWAATFRPRHSDGSATARKNSELEQADLVFVTSTFLLKTLEEVTASKATVAALRPGAVARDRPVSRERPAAGKKLRALFVGPLGQRQGLSYLFRACRELRAEVTLTVVGPPPSMPCHALERELREVHWHSAATAAEIRAEMATHDVLLAPSLFEGFNPVLTEALASGLPLIATPHTAAPDLIDDDVEGFIVPVRSVEEIVQRLEWLRREPERLVQMSTNAQNRARRYTCDHYERALAVSVKTALARH